MRVVDRTARDPRHLRAARALGRRQAPGRARAAGVQPPAHARHVEAPRAARRRRRHARPGRVAARDRPPAGAHPHLAAAPPPARAAQAARDDAPPARAQRGAERGARRLHERRQVDAPERADRLGGLVRRPPVRDARPDDALLRLPRAHVSPDRYGRLRAQAAAPARGRVRLDARGDAARRPRSCTSPTPRPTRRSASARSRRSSACSTRSAPPRCRACSCSTRWTRCSEEERRRLRNRNPDAVLVSARTGEGILDVERAIGEHFAGRFERVALLVPFDQGGVLAELYALGSPLEREDTAEGVLIRAHLPHALAERYAVVPARPDRCVRRPCSSFPCACCTRTPGRPRAPTRATRASTSSASRRPSWRRARAPRSAAASRSSCPRARAASCCRARGSRATTA